MVTFVEISDKEDEQITIVKKDELDVKDIDITYWTSSEKCRIKSWLSKLESEVDGLSWRFILGDNLCIAYNCSQESKWEHSGRVYRVRREEET